MKAPPQSLSSTSTSSRRACCKSVELTGCEAGEFDVDTYALVSASVRGGRFAAPSSRPLAAGPCHAAIESRTGALPDPFTAACLARPALPIYLQTAAFLC
jgi:hypothetical protein